MNKEDRKTIDEWITSAQKYYKYDLPSKDKNYLIDIIEWYFENDFKVERRSPKLIDPGLGQDMAFEYYGKSSIPADMKKGMKAYAKAGDYALFIAAYETNLEIKNAKGHLNTASNCFKDAEGLAKALKSPEEEWFQHIQKNLEIYYEVLTRSIDFNFLNFKYKTHEEHLKKNLKAIKGVDKTYKEITLA
ncbi:MAG: hypothetical protein ABIB43_01070 [archaeon]